MSENIITISEARSFGWSKKDAQRYGFVVVAQKTPVCLNCDEEIIGDGEFCDGSCALDWEEEQGGNR